MAAFRQLDELSQKVPEIASYLAARHIDCMQQLRQYTSDM